MDFGGVLWTCGHLAALMGMILVGIGGFSALLDGSTPGTWALFASGSIAILPIGVVRLFYRRPKDRVLARRDGMVTVVLTWAGLSALGALPFYLSHAIPSYLDALFETVSGFTTCGATILVDVEALPKGLLLWRSTTHWIGGMGIVVLFVAVLPALGIGGYQLYRAEVAGPSKERIMPTTRETAFVLWAIYTFFTVVFVLGLRAAGMPWFESVCHSFGGLATGGFSTRNASLGAYSPLIQTITVAMMAVGGVNFALWARLAAGLRRGNWQMVREVFRDEELRSYAALLAVGSCAIFAVLHVIGKTGATAWQDLLASVFQVVSIETTTGYTTATFDSWPTLCRAVLFVMMFIGGCAGSTAGGIKVVRILLAGKMLRRQVHTSIQARAVESIHLNGRPISENVLHVVITYIVFHVGVFVAGALLVALSMDIWGYGGDANFRLVSAVSAAAACLNAIGPGLAGAWANCAAIPAAGKVVLIASMLLGRLEIVSLLALFSPKTWRR